MAAALFIVSLSAVKPLFGEGDSSGDVVTAVEEALGWRKKFHTLVTPGKQELVINSLQVPYFNITYRFTFKDLRKACTVWSWEHVHFNECVQVKNDTAALYKIYTTI